jgi:hypothetical protein
MVKSPNFMKYPKADYPVCKIGMGAVKNANGAGPGHGMKDPRKLQIRMIIFLNPFVVFRTP